MNKNYIIFEEKGLFGLRGDTGDVLIEPQYKEMQPFSCGLSQVRNERFQYAYINAENRQVVPFGRYVWIDPVFKMGLARVKRNEKWGIIDTTGKVVLPIVYDKIWPLEEQYIHSIKATYKEKEITIDVNSFLTDNLLDGIVYHRTYSPKEIKEIFGVSKIEVKQDNKSKRLFFTISTLIGEVACNGIPQEPMISIVSNYNGRIFAMLHEAKDKGRESFITIPALEQNASDGYSIERDYRNDWREFAGDAFEGDESNYWNID